MTGVDMVYMEHKESGGSTRVPDDPGVIAAHVARGWIRADEPEEKPFVPPKDAPPPDEDGWVDLVHPGFNGRQRIPNDPAALSGAFEAGWEYPQPAKPEPDEKPAKKATAAKKAAASADEKDEG